MRRDTAEMRDVRSAQRMIVLALMLVLVFELRALSSLCQRLKERREMLVSCVVPIERTWRVILEPHRAGRPVAHVLMPLLESSTPTSFFYQSHRRGEALDQFGYPLRWAVSGWTEYGIMDLRERNLKMHYAYDYVPHRKGLGHKAPVLSYLDLARRYSHETGVPVALLLAVMQVESSGRPTLVSNSNAMGLMQIIPSEAGAEVAELLGHDVGAVLARPSKAFRHKRFRDNDRHSGEDGLPVLVSPRERVAGHVLFDPETNVRYGAHYLRLLSTRYFGRVRDGESRMLCTIAAYNLGPGRVLRLFDTDTEKAIDCINSYTKMELYHEIKARIRLKNDFTYMDKVISLIREYGVMGY